MDAAVSLFLEKGIAATSIDDVIDRAGVAKGTFYHYFRDRATLIENLRRRYSQTLADKVANSLTLFSEEGWPNRIRIWIYSFVTEYAATFTLRNALFSETSVHHPHTTSKEPIVQQLATLLQEGNDAHAWNIDNPMTAAICMFHALHGLADEAIAGSLPIGDVAPFIWRLFEKIVRINDGGG